MFDKIFVSSLIFVLIDFIYLNLVSTYFSKQIYIVQGSPLKLDILATIVCYLLLVFAINYFILLPKRGIIDAFLLGFVIYGVFEITNMALFSKWSWFTVLIDTLWGGILFALTTYCMKIIYG